jgi:hypothetical protein
MRKIFSGSKKVSGKISSLQKRLARVEQRLASIVQQAEPTPECNCRSVTVADPDKPEEFKAEMNQRCPAHGFRRLGMLVSIKCSDRRGMNGEAELDQLLKTYEARQLPRNRLRDKLRLSQLSQPGLEVKDGSTEG